MFRRSRFSIRPNVSTAGRAAAGATPQEATPASQEASETPGDVSERITAAAAATDATSDVTAPEKPAAPGDCNDQNGEGSSSLSAVQRRKRFSVKPKVAPGRPSALSRTPKPPLKATSETTVEVPGSDHEKPATSGPPGLQSPKRGRPSEESKQARVQSPPTCLGPSAVPQAEDSPEKTDGPTQSESRSGSPVKDIPPRPPDKVPPSLPDREADEISEKAKTLVSSKGGLSLSRSAFCLSRLLNDPSDLQRLAKAQKLRDLLRQERHKEKKLKKAKARPKEITLDPSKMTMRDLIRYLPESNPMTSSLEESVQENETVVPPSPVREECPERAQEPQVPAKEVSGEENEEAEDEEQDESLMVPQVKVAEDGSLIIDEESLTVEVQRAKGPNPAQDRDPIFERGSTTTYSSFRKGTRSKPWSSEETDMFFLAISMVGTDFSMICQLFPHRARSEIKNKFKKEERENSWRIDKAFRERRKLDIEYFSKLLEKILEVQKNRKKLRKLSVKAAPKKQKKKSKAAKKLSDLEEEDVEDNEGLDLADEKEGEKENEDLCNEGGTPDAKPKRQRKRKTRKDAVKDEPEGKKNKTDQQSNEQGEACTPEETEAALPEDQTNSDTSAKPENTNASKDAAIKPAKLSRGRAPKPLLPLGRKWGKKAPAPSAKAKDATSDKGDESAGDGASKEQENNDSSPTRQSTKRKSPIEDTSSEEEDATVQPPRPTRYGRVPKPTNPLNYPAKEEGHTSASDPPPASPARASPPEAKPKAKGSAKRGKSSKQKSAQESKKPKLVTLRALEYTDEEDEQGERDHVEMEEEEEELPACSPSKDGVAPVFVPASLRSPHPVISEVEETMEELDILANMPDVLGISQDALCPDASCELAQNERGTAEPCEHQLDLLVDVIDFLSSEHTEVSEDESYNEAAQTLLTIGNLTHLPQSVQNQIDAEDHVTGTTSAGVLETTQEAEQEENTTTLLMSGDGVREIPETTATVEPQNTTADTGDGPIIDPRDQMCDEQKAAPDMDPSPELQPGPESSRRGPLPKVKPKPDICRASRAEQPKSTPDTSTGQTAGDGNTETAIPQVTESASAPEQTTSKGPEYSPTVPIEDTVCQVESGAAGNHGLSDAPFEPCGEQADRDAGSTEEKAMSHAEIIMSSFNNSAASNTSVTESQVEQGLDTDLVPGDGQHVPAGDVPVSQKAGIEGGPVCQSRRSRVHKVKPKPNLPQTSRAARATPQTSEGSVEKDSSPTPVSQDHEEPTGSTSTPKTGENIGPVSTLTPTREPSTTEETHVEAVYSVPAASDQSDSGNQIFSQDLFAPCSADAAPTSESTDEKQARNDGMTESSNDLDKFVSTPQEPQVEGIAVEEDRDQPATRVAPVDSPAGQKAESEVASTSSPRKGRLQKVKPKPNIPPGSRTARSTPQSTDDSGEKDSGEKDSGEKDSEEKDSDSTRISQDHEKPIVDVEPEAACCASPQKMSENIDPALVSVPSLDLGSTLTPTRETQITHVEAVYSVPAASGQSDLFAPCSADAGPTSESTDEKQTTNDGMIEISNDLETFDSTAQESQVEGIAVEEGRDQPATRVAPVDSPAGQKAESGVVSTLQTRRGRLQKVKPKPNLAPTSRTARSKPQTTNASSPRSDPESTDNGVAEAEAQPICSVTPPGKSAQSAGTASGSVPSSQPCTSPNPTEELPSALEQNTDVGSDSNSQISEATVPQRRRHFPKVRPNLGSSTRTTQAKLQLKNSSKPSDTDTDVSSRVTSQQPPVGDSQLEVKLAEKGREHCRLSAELSSTGTNDGGLSSEGIVLAASSFGEWETTVDKASDNDMVEAGPSSRGHKTNPQPPDTLSSVADARSSEECKLNPALAAGACSTSDPQESSHRPESPDNDTELKNEDSHQQCSETSKTNETSSGKSQSAQSTGDPELTDSTSSSKKAPQRRRGRLVKPKPNLGRSSQPPQPQQVQNTTQLKAEDVDTSVSHRPETELGPDIQEPAEGAIEPHSSQESSSHDDGSLLGCLTQIIEHLSQSDAPTHDAGSSLGCVTQGQDSTLQNLSTLSSEATPSHPTLTMFPGMLSEQVPSDPDEPFFILSLTEIPVCSSGQAVVGAAEPLPYLQVADASLQQQHSGDPAESLVSVGDGSLSPVPAPVSTEESGDMGRVGDRDTGLDPAAFTDSIVDPHESATVQPTKLSETEEKNEDEAPSKQGPARPGRRAAKLQVGPNTTRKKQAGKSRAPNAKANANQDSELPGASPQPEAAEAAAGGDNELVTEPQESGERVNTEEKSPAGGDGPEGRSSRPHPRTTKPKVTSVEKRPGPPRDPSPGKASSKGFRGKTPRTTRKRSTPTAPAASASHSDAATPGVTRLPDHAHASSSTTTSALTELDVELGPELDRPGSASTPSTSRSSAQVSALQPSSDVERSSGEEEPTSVSQYFLSDIFTEVEEG